MLKPLPWMVVVLVSQICQQRARGVERPPSWRDLYMLCIAKIACPTLLTLFRGILLLDLIAKWYVSALVRGDHVETHTSEAGKTLGAVIGTDGNPSMS